MSKKSCFRRPFDKQHRKRVKPLLNSASKHLYHIHWSLPSQMSWKNSLFLIFQVLGLLVKTLAADEKSPVLTRDNLTIPIEMQFSRKQKIFSHFFAAFLKSRIKLKYFKKKMTLIDFVFRKLRPPKTWSDKCVKCPVLGDLSTSNMMNVPKHCWDLNHSIFVRSIDHCQVNWLLKRLSHWHAKSFDCFLTHLLPMKSILFLIEII